MKLTDIRDNKGATHPRKRIGRGIGSGTGKTSGKGHKGQNARSGVAMTSFEGGQMPVYRRLPKRGFHNIFRVEFAPVNLDRLQRAIDAGRLDTAGVIDEAALRAAGLINSAKGGVKLLAKGTLKATLKLRVAGASKSAIAAVEKAGGTVEVTAPRASAEATA
jgi:large subunit ribosomal protein L15